MRILPALLLLSALTSSAFAADVLTAQYDNSRTGATLAESRLTTSNVNRTAFGKLYTREVNGTILAEPLYLGGVTVQGRSVNIVYVVTTTNSVYAFDADNPAAAKPLWTVNLGAPDTASDFLGPLGILGTPAISLETRSLYLVSAHREAGHRVYRLHALELATGRENFGGPVVVSGQVSGTAPDSKDGIIRFDADKMLVRSGLAVVRGGVYFALGVSHDKDPSHGWVFGYDARSLKPTGIFNTTRAGILGGIWQSGRGIAADANGALYMETGNGDYDGKLNFGQSFLKLATPAVSLTDWFTPDNWLELNQLDWDLSATGPILIPGSNLLVGGSKNGMVYLMDTAKMGRLQPKNAQIVQMFQGSAPCHTKSMDGCFMIMAGQAFWPQPAGSTLFVWGVSDVLRAYRLVNGRFDLKTPDAGTLKAEYPGGMISVSSNAGAPGTGILWAVVASSGGSALHAFDARNLKRELWNSKTNPRDILGPHSNFMGPVVANGKVFVPATGKLVVYGLLQ